MKRRPVIIIYLELLAALRDGPLGPTHLARICNVPFDRLEGYLEPLVGNGLVRKEVAESHETFHATADGLQILNDLESVMKRLGSATHDR